MMTTPGYYIYLISSLPMLSFGSKPPFAFEKFLNICQGKIPLSDIEILKRSSIDGEYVYNAGGLDVLNSWQAFDTALRNELVKIRSARKKTDPAKYFRHDGRYGYSEVFHAAMAAHRSHSAIDAEKILDEARWRHLDELERAHHFDLPFLVVYAHKLLILERWDKVRSADKVSILEKAL